MTLRILVNSTPKDTLPNQFAHSFMFVEQSPTIQHCMFNTAPTPNRYTMQLAMPWLYYGVSTYQTATKIEWLYASNKQLTKPGPLKILPLLNTGRKGYTCSPVLYIKCNDADYIQKVFANFWSGTFKYFEYPTNAHKRLIVEANVTPLGFKCRKKDIYKVYEHWQNTYTVENICNAGFLKYNTTKWPFDPNVGFGFIEAKPIDLDEFPINWDAPEISEFITPPKIKNQHVII